MISDPPNPDEQAPPGPQSENAAPRSGADPAQSARQVADLFKQLIDMAAFWVATRIDRLRLKIVQILILAFCAMIAVVVAFVAVIVATVYVMNGVAGLIAELAGHRPWVGYGVVGAILLGGIAGGTWLAYRKIVSHLGSQMSDKYANWRKSQSDRFGESLGN